MKTLILLALLTASYLPEEERPAELDPVIRERLNWYLTQYN